MKRFLFLRCSILYKEIRFEDEELQKIWEMCVYTQRLCMYDVFMDCPWRERAFWMGDARLQILNAFYAFNDTKLARFCLTMAAESQRQNGEIDNVMPAGKSGIHALDYHLLWIISVNDFLTMTNDIAFVFELIPAIKKRVF